MIKDKTYQVAVTRQTSLYESDCSFSKFISDRYNDLLSTGSSVAQCALTGKFQALRRPLRQVVHSDSIWGVFRSRVVNNTFKKYWQYNFQKRIAISISILFNRPIAEAIPIL